MKRKALAALAGPAAAAPERCALCRRPPGARIEWHHVVPKSEGGRDEMRRFLAWIADKPPDFHAPARRGAS